MAETNKFISKESLIGCSPSYFTGQRSFEMVAEKDCMLILIFKDEEEFIWANTYTKIVMELRDFLGYWPNVSFDPGDENNGVLIQVKKFEYIFIGEEVYSFNTEEEILDYIHPKALSKNNVYFLPEKKGAEIDKSKLWKVGNKMININIIHGRTDGK